MKAEDIVAEQDKKHKQKKIEARQELAAENQVLKNVSLIESEPSVIPTPKKNLEGELTAVAVVSDNHAFEVVKKEEVNGLNEHNAKICDARLTKLFQKIVQLVDIERQGATIKNLVVGLIGDHMTNQMHLDQVETNDGTPMEEVLFLFEKFTGGFDYLLEHGGFDTISTVCCDGNHGRHTIKQQHANRAKHSYEWLLFQMLAKYYKDDPRVKFDIAEGQHIYSELYGRTIRWTHGDGFKYNGGVGGLTIPANKAIAQWDKGVRADFTIFGHYHTSYLDKRFLSNGASIGYGAYSLRVKAPFEPPSQSLLMVSPKYFISSYRPIYL